jgi:hypothetical protein
MLPSSEEVRKSLSIPYKTIQTASLITPSPNRIANSFGSCSSLIKVKAATESVTEITAENSRISFKKS